MQTTDNVLNVEMANIIRNHAALLVRRANRSFLRQSWRRPQESLKDLKETIEAAERLMTGADSIAQD